jgi:hypothetical protein
MWQLLPEEAGVTKSLLFSTLWQRHNSHHPYSRAANAEPRREAASVESSYPEVVENPKQNGLETMGVETRIRHHPEVLNQSGKQRRT